jgi:hypothetical protein
MSLIVPTYSFKDLTGAITTPYNGVLTVGGQLGVGSVKFTNTLDHTVISQAADGATMPSFLAGDAGMLDIECQQTSIVHHFLLDWFNSLKTAAMGDDVSGWAASQAYFRALTDGSIHQGLGLCPTKVPDKVYAAAGAMITWNLIVCSLTNL